MARVRLVILRAAPVEMARVVQHRHGVGCTRRNVGLRELAGVADGIVADALHRAARLGRALPVVEP